MWLRLKRLSASVRHEDYISHDSRTELHVLVVRQDEDDVRPDVASVSLDARLHPLSGRELSVSDRHGDEQEEGEGEEEEE